MEAQRGPKLGDAASLWNFTPSPGWSKEESLVLKLLLLRFGIGAWGAIQATGLLPGKLVQQLSSATQRLLGQQSTAAFTGLRVDVDRVRADNEAKVDAVRKNGLVIWSGPNPTREMRLQWQQEARAKYQISLEQQQEAEAALQALAGERLAPAAEAAAAYQAALLMGDFRKGAAVVPCAAAADAAVQAALQGVDQMGCDVDALPTGHRQLLLCALHGRLLALLAQAANRQPELLSALTALSASPVGWIACGPPGQGGAGARSSGAEDYRQSGGAHNPSRDAASLLVAQAGAAARQGKVGSSSSSGAGNSSSRAAGKAAGGGCTKRARKVGGSSSGSGSGTARAHKRAVGASGAAAHARSRRRRSAVDDDAPDEAAPFEMGEAQQAALDAGVAALQELGFSRPKALDALMECGCDVELAAEYLASTCC